MSEQLPIVQRWEGHIIEVHETEFTAKLFGMIGDMDELEADIYKSAVHPDDVELIDRGAVFYWTISGTCEDDTVSEIRFKRWPKWTQDDFDKAARDAEKFKRIMNGED